MEDLKNLELKIEKLGSEFLATSKKNYSVWLVMRNKLAEELWNYAKELRKIKYYDIPEYDFEESISDTIISCLKATPHFWIKEFKTALHRNVFKNKTVESKRGLVHVSNDVIKLGRNLENWAKYKGLTASITKRNSLIDEKLFEYGRSWGKSDSQIKKALDWLDKKYFIAGNDHVGNDDSESEKFDSLSEESLFGFDDSFDIKKQKVILYITAANDEYEGRRKKDKPEKLSFYSKWFTNLILAALLKENFPNTDIAKTIERYKIIDKSILADFQTKQDWRPNTNRNDIGMNCGIKEKSIGNVDDRFKKDVMTRYMKLLENENLK